MLKELLIALSRVSPGTHEFFNSIHGILFPQEFGGGKEGILLEAAIGTLGEGIEGPYLLDYVELEYDPQGITVSSGYPDIKNLPPQSELAGSRNPGYPQIPPTLQGQLDFLRIEALTFFQGNQVLFQEFSRGKKPYVPPKGDNRLPLFLPSEGFSVSKYAGRRHLNGWVVRCTALTATRENEPPEHQRRCSP